MDRVRTKDAPEESPRAEDYLEAVLNLISEKGYATTSDISSRLNVRPPTASQMTRRLVDKGYLEHEPYRTMKLTRAGEKVARSVIKRHRVISDFFSMIGVDDQTAYVDTEGIEHHVHPATLRRLERLAAYLRTNKGTLRAIQKFIDEE